MAAFLDPDGARASLLAQHPMLPSDHAAAEGERAELTGLLNQLRDCRPALAQPGSDRVAALDAELEQAAEPLAVELALERFSRDLRALWLRAVSAETAHVLRSPTQREERQVAAGHDGFGYERDLQPQALEARCDAFFGAVPEPWAADHVLFSSGQAPLLTVLLSFRSAKPLRVRHLGGYFETGALIESCPALCQGVESDSQIVIAEPVASNGGFDLHDLGEIAAACSGATALVIDTTLLGRSDGLAALLGQLDPQLLVLRYCSGLKLLQTGLELANVGTLGVHSGNEQRLARFAEGLREMRTLAGSGLRFADVLALEAPFVFDPGYADRYVAAIGAHNAALAQAVAATNRLFLPPFTARRSPYCVFTLADPAPGAYDRLSAAIETAARGRKIAFERGGSFGFRGHRFEVVRPEQRPPFLRVAMGRRGGWSCRGSIAMLAEIASRSSI